MAGAAAVEAKTDDLDNFRGEDGHAPLKQTQDWRDIHIATGLTEGQRSQVTTLLADHKEIFSDLPGKTDLVQCQ
ncbi:hypothetical protein MRX96_048466 [Rhipicephalus microplus]